MELTEKNNTELGPARPRGAWNMYTVFQPFLLIFDANAMEFAEFKSNFTECHRIMQNFRVL